MFLFVRYCTYFQNGNTALLYAASYGQASVVALLLGAGVNMETVDDVRTAFRFMSSLLDIPPSAPTCMYVIERNRNGQKEN